MNPNPAPIVVAPSHRSLAVSEPVSRLVEASIAANTKRAYRHALKKFDEVVAGYLADRFNDPEKFLSSATCAQIVAAIKFRAKLQGKPSPTGPLTDRVLSGIRASLPNPKVPGDAESPGSGSAPISDRYAMPASSPYTTAIRATVPMPSL